MAAPALSAVIAAPGGAAILGRLNKIGMNILTEPENEMFRRLRKANAGVAAILSHPGAAAVLASLGFVDAGEFLTLPAGSELNAEAMAALMDAVDSAPPQQAVAPAPAAVLPAGGAGGGAAALSPERRAELEALKAKRDAEKRERERILAAAARDRAEREARDRDRPVASSKATTRAFGMQCSTFKDIGVDLNAKGG